MAGIELIQSFLNQATAHGSRSTALSPLGWLIAILVSALLGALWAEAPHWIIVCLMTALCAGVLLYVGAYIFFMIKSPDHLRSEKFSLSKLAIERSIQGDNITGLIDPKTELNKARQSLTEPTEVKQ